MRLIPRPTANEDVSIRRYRARFCNLRQRLRHFEHLLRPGPHPVVLGEVDPANRSRRIHQKLSRPRDIVSVNSGALVQQIVTPDRLGPGIRKKRIGVTSLLREKPRFLGRVDADRNRLNAGGAEIGETLFDTP